MTLRTVTYEGTLTALSSLANSDKQNGTTRNFRRESVACYRDGAVKFAPVPILSGSVLRGSMRRLASEMVQAVLGDDDGRQTFQAVHAFRSGGALRETRTAGEVLTGERQALLRDLIPMLGLFGTSAGGRIMSGRLVVDKAVPLAQETAHLARNPVADPSRLPSIYELLQREAYGRFADVNDAAAAGFASANPEDEDGRTLPKGGGMIFWGQETLIPGTVLMHEVVLEAGTPMEVSFLDDLINRWSTRRIGAQRARGMGRVRMDYTRTVTDLLGDPCTVTPLPEGAWQEHMRTNADQIKDVLTWL